MKIITRSFYVFTVLLFAGMIYVHKFDTSFAVKNSQENIELGKNGKSINYYSKKTKKYVHTICNDITFDLLKKYRFNLPHISGQKYNEYIKEVCELAGIDNIITVHTYKSGQAIKYEKQKFKLISSHTARRSFVTNLYKKNVGYVMVLTEATLLQKTIHGLITSQSSTSLLKLKTFSLGIVLME